MTTPKLPLDRRWLDQELKPYLRCAFSHTLSKDDDITPVVYRALEFCMHKADHASDGDDLLFERICHAIQFRYRDFGPDLRIVTESLEALARFLIRRAQLKGPYELGGRMNIATGAWREYDAGRLGRLRQVAEKEKNDGPSLVSDPPPKAAPAEDQIDPRLIHARPGQYVAPNLPSLLTVAEDRYHRNQNRVLSQYRQRNPPAPSWQEQIQQATTATLPVRHSHQGSSDAWMHGQPSVHNPPPVQSLAPSHIQNFGQRQLPDATQPLRGNGGTSANHPMRQSVPFSMLQQPFTPTMSMQAPAQPRQPFEDTFTRQSHPAPQQAVHHPKVQSTLNRGAAMTPTSPVDPTSMMSFAAPTAWFNSRPASDADIPISDITHLRGDQWVEAAEKRAHDFSLLSRDQKAWKLLQLYQPDEHSNFPQETSPPTRASNIAQEHASSMPSVYSHPAASSLYQAAPPQPQPAHLPHQQTGAHGGNSYEGQTHGNHPGYSNITSAFPDLNAMYEWSMQKPSAKR